MTKFLFLGLGLPGISLFLAAVAAAESLPSPTVLILPTIIILILVVINGVFVAAEFAIIGVRDTLGSPCPVGIYGQHIPKTALHRSFRCDGSIVEKGCLRVLTCVQVRRYDRLETV